jgi:hypothetical protein
MLGYAIDAGHDGALCGGNNLHHLTALPFMSATDHFDLIALTNTRGHL